MKPFGEWLHSNPTKHESAIIERPAESAEKRKLQHEIDVLRELVSSNFSDLNWNDTHGYTFRCCRCDEWKELEDIDHYNPSGMYCGGSQYCCP